MVSSFRPISLLEVLEKLLDTKHTFKTTIYTTRGGSRGTGSPITLAYEIALRFANKHQTNIMLQDVTKAFDKVCHDGLKYKIT